MKRFFQSSSSIIVVFLVLCLGLNACTPPGKMVANRSEQSQDGFRILQENNDQEPPEPNPLDGLPEGDDPDKIVLLAADSNTPIKVTVEQDFPRNRKLQLQNVQFQPSIIEPVFVKGNTPEEIKTLEKAHLKATLKWYKDLYRYIRRTLLDTQRQDLKNERDKFERELAFADSKADKKALRQQFEKEQKERRATYKQQRTELKQARKQDVERLKEDVFQQFQGVQSGFNIKVTGIEELIILGIFLGVIALGFCAFIPSCLGQWIQEAIQNAFKQKPAPPPYVPADHYTYPANSSSANRLPPDVSVDIQNLEALPAQVIPTDVLYNQALNYLQSSQVGGAGFSVRSKDVLEGLGFTLDASDLARYSHCNTRSELGALPENCDEALKGLLNGIDQNNLPGYITPSTFRDGGTSSYVYSVRFNSPVAGNTSSDTTVKQWLQHLFKQYPNSLATNQAKLEQLNYTFMGLEIRTPPTCKNPKTMKYETQGIVSFSMGQPGSLSLVDGDYTAEFYVSTPKSQKKYIDQAKVTITNMSDKLGKSAYKLKDKNLQPLTLADVKPPPQQPPSHKILHVQVNNKTANHWNATVEKVSTGTNSQQSSLPCRPLYSVECMSTASGTFHVETRYYEAGLYRLNAQYSTSTYPDGRPVKAENLSAKHTEFWSGIRTEGLGGYKFLVPNLVFSSFARYSDYPESVQISSKFNPNIPSDTLSHLLNFNQGLAALDWPEEFEGSLNQPTLPSRPLAVPTIPSHLSNVHGVKIVDESLRMANTVGSFFQTNGEAPWQTAIKERLFLDLSKTDANQVPYAPFRNTTVAPSDSPRFLNVGAVVNLSNRVFRLNEALAGGGFNSVPLILEVQKIQGSQAVPVAKWRFNAPIGAYTVIQTYWDGQPRTLDDDENAEEAHSPSYDQGNYKVVVSLDNEVYNEQAWYTNMRARYDGAYVMQPLIAKVNPNSNSGEAGSTTVTVEIQNNVVPTPTPSQPNIPYSDLDACSSQNICLIGENNLNSFGTLANTDYLEQLKRILLSLSVDLTVGNHVFTAQMRRLESANTQLREELRKLINTEREELEKPNPNKRLIESLVERQKKNMGIILDNREKHETYHAAIIYINNLNPLFACESCLREAIKITGKFDRGSVFERELGYTYQTMKAPFIRKDFNYSLNGTNETFEMDFETRERLGEISNQMKRAKADDGVQIERHLEYARTQGKPLELIYGFNTNPEEIKKIQTDFRGQIQAGKLILTDWREVILPPL